MSYHHFYSRKELFCFQDNLKNYNFLPGQTVVASPVSDLYSCTDVWDVCLFWRSTIEKSLEASWPEQENHKQTFFFPQQILVLTKIL